MINRRFLNLLLGLVILTVFALFVIGCGEEEEEELGQDLVGTWIVETIDGEPLLTEEDKSEPWDWWFTDETEEEVYIASETIEFTFSDVSEGKFNMDDAMKFKMDEYLFTVKVTVSGTYTVSDSNITMVNKDQTVDVDLPQELIEKGFTEDDAKEIAWVEDFEEEPLEGTYTVSGNTLTITETEEGETYVIVFKKKQ